MTYIKTTEMTHEQWVESRRSGIGGSDVAGILGLSKYKTPLDIYHEKVDGVRQPENQAMFAGKLLEPVVADWYMQDSGRQVVRDNKIRIHKDFDFMIANLDRIILPQNSEGRGILEIKTAGIYAAKYWQEEPPIEYVCQIQHYLDVTGYAWGEFAVLIGGQEFKRYPVERDDEFIRLKNERLAAFWYDHIEKRIPPEPSNPDEIEELYPVSVGKVIEARPETYQVYAELKEKKELLKQIETEVEEREEQLKMALRDAEILASNGVPLVTWKAAKNSVTFDSKRFQAENSDLASRYMIEKPGSRRFLVK